MIPADSAGSRSNGGIPVPGDAGPDHLPQLEIRRGAPELPAQVHTGNSVAAVAMAGGALGTVDGQAIFDVGLLVLTGRLLRVGTPKRDEADHRTRDCAPP